MYSFKCMHHSNLIVLLLDGDGQFSPFVSIGFRIVYMWMKKFSVCDEKAVFLYNGVGS